MTRPLACGGKFKPWATLSEQEMEEKEFKESNIRVASGEEDLNASIRMTHTTAKKPKSQAMFTITRTNCPRFSCVVKSSDMTYTLEKKSRNLHGCEAAR
jgi:hypothetical protein